MKVSANFNTIPYTFKSNGNQTNPVDTKSVNNQPVKTDNTKKIVIGSAIAAGILVLFLARKNISKFVKELFNKGEKEIPKETPKTSKSTDTPSLNPKPPKAPGAVVEPEVSPNIKPVQIPQNPVKEYRKLLDKLQIASEKVDRSKIPPELEEESDKLVKEIADSMMNNAVTKEQLARQDALIAKRHAFSGEDAADKVSQEIKDFRKLASKENLSLVEKAEFSLDPNVDVEAKRAYFNSSKVAEASFNEASQLDYLEMFDKYGSRYWLDEKIKTHSLLELGTCVGHNASDKVLSKYIDIMDKIAIRDGKGNLGMRDASGVLVALQFNSQNMSKETFLKCIKVLKKTSYQQVDAIEVETALIWTKFREDKEVLSAIEDLKNSLKDFPEIDKSMN